MAKLPTKQKTGRVCDKNRSILTKEGQLIHAILLKKGSVARTAQFLRVSRQQAFRWCVYGHISLKHVAKISMALDIPPVCLNFKQVNELIEALGSSPISWERTVQLADL